MFEIHFDELQEKKALSWLEEHRKNFSVLVHEDTGDDLSDHQCRVRWLGTELPIHFDFFHSLAKNPSLAIHSKILGACVVVANPTEIQNFLEIYRTHHISKAAIRLGVTQPTLTQSLQKLEEKIGSQLFLRTKQGVLPTQAGQLFYSKAQKLLESWRDLQEGITNSQTALEGKFRIGCHASVANYTLPLFLKNLSEHAPKIDIELIHDFSRKINEGIISYAIDLGFVVNPVRHPDLVLKKLGDDQVSFWKARGTKNVPQKLFADASLIQIESLLTKTFAKRFESYQVVQTSSLELIRTLVSEGHGVGILPARVAKQKGFDLTPFDQTLPTYPDEIYLAYRKEALSSRAGKELIRLAHIRL